MEEMSYCRLCALKLSSSCIKSTDEINNEKLNELFFKYLNIELGSNEGLPQTACLDCCIIVSNFHEYYNRVQSAQNILGELLKPRSEVDWDVKEEIKTDIDDISLDNDEDYQPLYSVKYEKANEELIECENEENKEKDFKRRTSIKSLDTLIDFKCYKCEKVFHTAVHLEQHFYEKHQAETVEYMCTECKALFLNYNEFEEHVHNEHPNLQKKHKLYRCDICDKMFVNSTSFQAHRNVHLGILPFECEVCNRKFSLKQHMLVHRNTVCGKKSNISKMNKAEESTEDNNLPIKKLNKQKRHFRWKCYKCNIFYKTPQLLEDHFQKIHEESPVYFCIFCYTLIEDSRQEFHEHLNKEHRFKKQYSQIYHCDICEKEFSNSTNLKNHQYTHSGVKRFTCDVCGKKCTLKQNLEAHKLTHTKIKSTFNCEFCNKKLMTEHNLAKHLKSHLFNKQYECDICNKKYMSEENLIKHKEWHDKNQIMEENICDQCGKVFKTKYQLSAHMYTHTEETPYHCDECSKTFKYINVLRIHKKSVHTDIRPFECEECGKKFHIIGRLNLHKKIHAKNYAHECHYCNKKFIKSDQLRIHMRQHTGERPFACLECKHYFTNGSNFKKHLKGRHGLKNFTIANNHQYPFNSS